MTAKIVRFFMILLIIICASSYEQGFAAGKFLKSDYKKKHFQNIALTSHSSCGANGRYIVFEENNRLILSEQNSASKAYPASLVKLMTLYLTFEALSKHQISLNQQIIISDRAEEISRVNQVNSLRLKTGNKILVKQAIEGVIVKSFNEAAVALAEVVAGDEWNFSRMMNQKALQLQMVGSSFRNSSGLHEEGQYSNASDLAKLTFALRRDFPQFYRFFSLKNFRYKNEIFKTHNHVLLDFKGAEGMKTGFTRASGFNLISSAKRGKSRIFAVLVGCESAARRDKFMTQLLESGFFKINKLTEAKSDIEKMTKISFDEPYKNSIPRLEDEKIKQLELQSL